MCALPNRSFMTRECMLSTRSQARLGFCKHTLRCAYKAYVACRREIRAAVAASRYLLTSPLGAMSLLGSALATKYGQILKQHLPHKDVTPLHERRLLCASRVRSASD